MPNFFVEGCVTLASAEQVFLKDLCKQVAHEDMLICEVGCWVGLGTKEFASVAKENRGLVYCADWFLGVPGIPGVMPSGETNDIFSIFKQNMKELELWDNICTLHMTSKQAANISKDNAFDLIFIDAGHCYTSIREDIDLWLPKLKSGGIICGHDCECTLRDCPIDVSLYLDSKTDCVAGIHPGVVKAVFETFPEAQVFKPSGGQGIWYMKVLKND